MSYRFCRIALVSTLLFLGGCQAVAMGVAGPMLAQPKKVNLVNSSYAAADTLAQQSQKSVTHEEPLVVSDLQEVIDSSKKNPARNPKVGHVLADQMSARFLQLGYNVVDRNAVNGNPKAMAEMSGSYEIVGSTVNIGVRMTDRKTGRAVGVFNYSIPLTYELRKHMARSVNIFPKF